MRNPKIQIMILKIVILTLMLIPASAASPDYPSGIVTRVVDGDTFEVQGFGLVSLSQADNIRFNRGRS